MVELLRGACTKCAFEATVGIGRDEDATEPVLRLVVVVAGLALVAYGFALAWLPLAFIVPGALLVAGPVVGAVVEARAARLAPPQPRRAP